MTFTLPRNFNWPQQFTLLCRRNALLWLIWQTSFLKKVKDVQLSKHVESGLIDAGVIKTVCAHGDVEDLCVKTTTTQIVSAYDSRIKWYLLRRIQFKVFIYVQFNCRVYNLSRLNFVNGKYFWCKELNVERFCVINLLQTFRIMLLVLCECNDLPWES